MRTDTVSRSAISRLLSPAATRLAISRSRTVNGNGCAARSSAGVRIPPHSAASRFAARGRLHAAATVVGALEHDRGLRGRIGRRQQRTDLLELVGRRGDPGGVAVTHRGRVRRDHRGQPATGGGRHLDEPVQAGLVAEAHRVVQRQHVDRLLP